MRTILAFFCLLWLGCAASAGSFASFQLGSNPQFVRAFSACSTSGGTGVTPSLDCSGVTDINGVQLGGTEIRNMVFHLIPNGSPMPGNAAGSLEGNCSSTSPSWSSAESGCIALFAGNGYWSDIDCPSSTQKPQVIALANPVAHIGSVGGWVQDGVLPTPTGTTCDTAGGGNSAFTVTNAIEDLPFKYNTSGTVVNTHVLIGSGSSTTLLAYRRDDLDTWPTFSDSPGVGITRALGEHDDLSGTPASYLLVGNDGGNITDFTWTSNAVGFAGGTNEAWPASTGCSGGTGSPASCTNLAADWSGQTIPASNYTITASGTTVTITWYSGATDTALSGQITVSGFAVGTGGSGASNGNGTFTVSGSTTALTYTASGTVVCGTGAGCTATLKSSVASPLQQSSGCVFTGCGLNATPRTRIMSIISCAGSAFLGVGAEIYHRVDAGTSSTWELWAVMPLPDAAQTGVGNGFRAISCVPWSSFSSGYALLATTQSTQEGSVWRMDPGTKLAIPFAEGGTGAQCPSSAVYCGLQGIGNLAWDGGGPGDNGEASGGGPGNGYNTGTIFPYPLTSPTVWLFGEGDSRAVGIASDHPSWNGAPAGVHSEASSGFFVRSVSGTTASYTLYPTGNTFSGSQLASQYAAMTPKVQWSATGGSGLANNLSPYCTGGLCSVMVSTRVIVVSQFPSDQCQYLYLGGFDASPGSHDTAWILREDVRQFSVLNAANIGHC